MLPVAPSSVLSDLGVCLVEAKPGFSVIRVDAFWEAIDAVVRFMRAVFIDVGGVEYLVFWADGYIYYYDVNAISNFVANAFEVVGFDPIVRFVDYIVRAVQGGAKQFAV